VTGGRGVPELRTERLLLRRWRAADREPFAELNADPEVMEYLSAPLSRAESDGFADEIEARFALHGYGLWAVEPLAGPDAGAFAGFVGLNPVRPNLPYAPAVEVGWRLARRTWGRGYATEAGEASIRFGFERAGLDEIVSFASVGNERSLAVMRRLGMSRDPADDFLHPDLAAGDPLRPHALYRIRRPG
jgi:RimJ/RimL family protein N-acetyltransferase